MNALLETLLVVWGASLVVLTAALTLVVLVQGAARHVRSVTARVRRTERTAVTPVSGRQTQPV